MPRSISLVSLCAHHADRAPLHSLPSMDTLGVLALPPLFHKLMISLLPSKYPAQEGEAWSSQALQALISSAADHTTGCQAELYASQEATVGKPEGEFQGIQPQKQDVFQLQAEYFHDILSSKKKMLSEVGKLAAL